MKRLSYLSSILALFLLLVSCGKDGSDPTPNTATFRVDFNQSGDYQKFVRIISITGGEFKYKGTNDIMPPVLIQDDLKTASFSVEATNVEELEIETHTEFLSVETGPASMAMKFTIYKDGILLDEKTFNYTEATKGKVELLNYKAN